MCKNIIIKDKEICLKWKRQVTKCISKKGSVSGKMLARGSNCGSRVPSPFLTIPSRFDLHSHLLILRKVETTNIAALFTTARIRKQPRCPSKDEWIKKLWYIYTLKYYSTIKRNAFEWVLMRWMNLEPIIQSEVSQREKFCLLTHIWNLETWYWWTYLQSSSADAQREQTCTRVMGRKERVRWMERGSVTT